MLEKLLLRKFCQINKKAPLVARRVAFLFKNLSCPIHPPIAIPKTDSRCFLCFFRDFSKLLGERLWWNHFLVR